MRSLVARVSSLTLALWLGACAEDDAPTRVGAPPLYRIAGCETIDHASCDVREAACQERLLDLTACIRGEDRPSMPPVTVMTEPEFSDYLYSTLDEQDTANGVDHVERALVTLGMVEPNALQIDAVIADEVEKIAGVYRSSSDDVLIVDHGEASDQDTTSNVLVHEFVHYLQDRQVDLEAFRAAVASTTDAVLAARSVSEGEAELHQIRHYAALLGLDPNAVDYGERFEAMVRWSEQYLREQPSPFTQVHGVFPYSWGGRFMELSWQVGGRDAVAERFAAPPSQTRTLMVDAGGVIPEDVDALTFASPEPAADWSLHTEDVGGAFLLFLYLTTLTTPDEARSLSLAWRGDRLSIFSRDVGDIAETVVVWRFAFVDSESRERFSWLVQRAGTRTAIEGDTTVALAAAYTGALPDWALVP